MILLPVKNNLKSLRHKHEMNQKEFAEYLGLSSWAYNRYENQAVQPTLEVALMIAEKLEITVNEIFYRESDQ